MQMAKEVQNPIRTYYTSEKGREESQLNIEESLLKTKLKN